MSNNPSATLARPRTSVKFCLAAEIIEGDLAICTRIETHTGHCCDEVRGVAWTNRGVVFVCKGSGYDHSAEKGL